MRTKNLLIPAACVVLVVLLTQVEGIGQTPQGQGKGAKGKGPQGPPSEQNEILKEIKEAYKAQYEVHEDVLKELRRQYQQPSLDREAKIFKEIRRLYQTTPEQEQAILGEIRRAYERPSPEQEERVFQMIRRAERLPEGTVPLHVQDQQAVKLFRNLDQNGDGLLSSEEMTDALRIERARWDRNSDGFIDLEEYRAYYQVLLRSTSEQVASGEIQLGLRRGGPNRNPPPIKEEDVKPVVARAGKLPSGLPAWFAQLDTDGDAQVGLYEWRKSGRPLEEFMSMDRNDDGFLTIDEVLRYVAQQSGDRSGNSARADGGKGNRGGFAQAPGASSKTASDGKPKKDKNGQKQ